MSRIDVNLFQLIWFWDQLWPEVYLKPNSLALIILSAKWSQFTEITLWHWCSPVNLLHTFRTPFPKSTSGELLLTLVAVNYFLKKVSSQLFGRFFNILLREKCPYSELFWSVFSRIRTECGEMLRIFFLVSFRIHPECGKIRTRITQNNFVKSVRIVLMNQRNWLDFVS